MGCPTSGQQLLQVLGDLGVAKALNAAVDLPRSKALDNQRLCRLEWRPAIPSWDASPGLSHRPAAGIPQPQAVVPGAGDDAAAIGAERHRPHPIGVALKRRAELLAAAGIPQAQAVVV